METSRLLEHPWLQGDGVSNELLSESASKLARYTRLRRKLKAGVLALIMASNSSIQRRKPLAHVEIYQVYI